MSEPNTFDPLLDSLVASADEGAIGFWLIVNVVQAVQSKLAESTSADARAATLALVREALKRRVLVAGTIDRQFTAWHVSADDAIERIDRAWTELGRDPMPGEVATFTTPARLGFS